ncbi:hypothetical protein [Aliagarivorans taiwanensis]|uniref:type IVB secretion system protein IcmW n=1 Tax=Aliagarivorans taiwanensis TaxID=561966 RepID=UPI0012F70B1D|nr:hypothetical protein [Aliagarivorans taiwanensis]
MARFDEPTRAIITLAMKREHWPVDGDPEVLEAIGSLSGSMEAILKQADVDLDDVEISGIDAAAASIIANQSPVERLPAELLLELQGQLNLPRSIKMFGDTCQFNPARAKEMLEVAKAPDGSEALRDAGRCTVNRLLFLARMNLISRVFCSESRIATTVEALKNYLRDDNEKD